MKKLVTEPKSSDR